MPNATKPKKSNTERGLELHVDPAHPTGPLLTQRPDMTKLPGKAPKKPAQEAETIAEIRKPERRTRKP